MSRTRVAVVFGGRSTEHAISCLSAAGVLAALDRESYDVIAVGITPEGRWLVVPDDPSLLAARGRELPSVPDGTAVALPPDPTAGGLIPLGDGPVLLGGVDVVFPVLHGPYGEDGTVQGLLEMAGLPYVGSGVLSSAAAMDKAVAKKLLSAAGLPVAPARVITARSWAADPRGEAARVQDLDLPVFVKPARGGSSIGISRVEAWDQLPGAVEEALRSDPKVLVEAGIAGREVEMGVLAGVGDAGPEASVPAEIRVVGDHAFYDFEAKYLDDATELHCPADLSPDIVERLQDMALRAFAALECEGLARVDFFVGPQGQITVNEVNTMPGFTASSMFPRMWAASGVPYPELVDRLVQAALLRGSGLH
ncbi:MAG TPA: D-alanine--D-alanine ligase family protein [Mycobacteriales bacterium]|nr:D-alanine--D-alanine ligase family protein [Mycobacteriales bacterium]